MRLTTSLPREVVETQLAQIVASRHFCNAPRLSRFLTYVVEESLAGRSDRLKGYAIALEVFDKPADFDPQTDTIVRVQARALRQKLDQYYAQDGIEDPVHISIAKGSYEPAFFVSLDGEKSVDQDVLMPQPLSNKPSIAVMPFDDFSSDHENGYYALGLTEEIIADLSRFKGLSVFSRVTTEKAKLDHLSIGQIYDLFAPDFVLEGSLRISKKSIHVTIQLVDASLDEIILTDQFHHESTPEAYFQMQDKMALQIASKITDRFGPLGEYAGRAARSGQAQKWETYYWISRYHQYAVQLSPAVRQEIKEGLIRSLNGDAESSDAHAALSLIMADEYRLSLTDDHIDDIPDQVWDHAQISVTCDPQNAIAHEALATVYYHRGDFENFDRSAQQALRLNPGHGDMMARIGMCYGARANWAVALPLFDRAIELSPFNPGWYHVMRAVIFALTKGPNEALAEIRVSPLPEVFFYHGYLIWFLVELGDMKAAHREKVALLNMLPDYERVAARHARLWHLDESITSRLYAALHKVGLNVSE